MSDHTDPVECVDAWAHAAKTGPLQVEITRLREAADAALDWMENVTHWVGPGVPEDRDDVVTQLRAALGIQDEQEGHDATT
jgi:hypothetical protein